MEVRLYANQVALEYCGVGLEQLREPSLELILSIQTIVSGILLKEKRDVRREAA